MVEIDLFTFKLVWLCGSVVSSPVQFVPQSMLRCPFNASQHWT